MSLIKIMFYLMSLVAVGSALTVAMSRNLVRSIFMFFITLFALAGLYVLCLADFVAVTQIVIYVGGILVLILFAFMLSGKEALAAAAEQENKFISLKNWPALLLAGLFWMVMVNVVLDAKVDGLEWLLLSKTSNTAATPGINNIGINLMTRYLLPFEAISILLMIALVGAAHLSRKEDKQ
ncbi:NADH-quinone oxidoreductase subunit J [Mucilaginibacter terrenus]|uniref:NADH-quinone oxidoreductase subunit J n=1 Tax=Mucilaginibacter terrenus TaxID=2482727 RepID=A0A3E2NXB3_9SPHI|nr:NADH-quinone oxidoreductase subunit J [Mucilaginibacter terrenus]RFZ85655.1 NADH-quinone oxidoreductase subunit J [Mucilaginibacter terrenus]